MSSTPKFDPYYRWLGISPKDQPPHHYRLLAVDLFERDADVIALAADQRMAHLKTFQAGPTAEFSQRLLNEVATARVCLLNADKKAAYDAQLKERLSKRPKANRATSPKPAMLKAQPLEPDVIGSIVAQEAASGELPGGRTNASRKQASRAKPTGMKGPVAYGVVILLVGVVGLATTLWVRSNSWQIEEAEAGPSKPPASEAVQTAKTETPAPPPIEAPTETRRSDGIAKASDEAGIATQTSLPEVQPTTSVAATPAAIASSNSAPKPPIGSAAASVENPPPLANAPSDANDRNAPGRAVVSSTPAATDVREPSLLPIPDAESLEKASQLVKEVFKDDIAQAKSPSLRTAIAEKLLEQAGVTEDDHAARYVMLQVSLKLAIDATDFTILERVIGRVASIHAVDADQMRIEAFKKISDKSLSAKQNKNLADLALESLDSLESDDRYELAERYQAIAIAAARKAQDPALVKQAVERGKNLATAKQHWEAAQHATTVLADRPNDPEANLALGKYLCFSREKWEQGWPHLAKGGDAKIAELARQSLENPSDGAAQVALGDAWWNTAEKSTAATKANFQKASRYWYAQAVEKLNGLSKARVEQRLQTLDSKQTSVATPKASSSRSPTPKRRPRKGDWVVIFRSFNPEIWNHDVNIESHYAVSLAEVPDNIKYLKMQIPGQKPVVIEMSKASLDRDTVIGKFGWKGDYRKQWEAIHFGIYDTSSRNRVKGDVKISGDFCGWGFGDRHSGPQGQAYSWASKPIDPTMIEIAVKSGELSDDEKTWLLQ